MRPLALLPALLLIAACQRGGETVAQTPGPDAATEMVADTPGVPAAVDRITIDGVDFPSGMEEAPPEVLEAYVFAAKHPEVLSYMPCYCGCENPQFAHDSNYDCFVDAIDTTGAVPRVDPDPMGFG